MTEKNDLGTIAGRYRKLARDREYYLQRAREMAVLTVPALFPPEGFSKSGKLTVPFQNLGARGVNNIANKLHLTLLPPNSPFFRYQADVKARQQAVEKAGDEKKVLTEIEKALAQVEKDVQSEIEAAKFRPQLFEGIRQLVVGGNTLLHLPKKAPARVFNLANYVVCRDGSDAIYEIIVHEKVSEDSLPPAIKAQLTTNEIQADKRDDDVDVYTWIRREEGSSRYVVSQELKGGIKLPAGDGAYPSEAELPWFPLRLVRIEGENYGRSYAEEYQGDLQSLEGLTQSLVEGAAIMAKVVFLLKPNGTLKPTALAQAENGAVMAGDREDVDVLQVEKYADFKVVMDAINRIEQRLEFAFLLNTAVQRDAERVTAEEIRYMAQELEGALGGVYSLLSQEFQLRLISVFVSRMAAEGKIPKLKESQARPVIITGVEALGRGNDLNKLRAFMVDLIELAKAKPDLVQRVRGEDLIKRLALGHGLPDADNLLIGDEEFEQMQQQQQQQAMMADLASKTLPGVAQTAVEKITDGQTANPAEA